MELGFRFFFNSICLGIGLAMDAFSVSLCNGLNDPSMKRNKMAGIAAVFSIFQGLMPMIGWICVHTIVQYFTSFEVMIPWIALSLLCWIGSNMVYDGIKHQDEQGCCNGVCLKAILIQGVATSIDALSVGFTIAEYTISSALLCVILIAAVTFVICFAGIEIGKKAGTKLSGKAGILGGVILILVGIEIFLEGVL